MASLKAKLFAAASANSGLVALLKSGTGPFRWWDTQCQQQYGFPAVVVRTVSNPNTYTVLGALPTSFARVQFTVFGTGNDSENANAVVNALKSFLATFSAGEALSVPAYPNLVVGDRDFGIAQTDPLTFQRIIDVQIFNNDLV
jgi:hypothetical protein